MLAQKHGPSTTSPPQPGPAQFRRRQQYYWPLFLLSPQSKKKIRRPTGQRLFSAPAIPTAMAFAAVLRAGLLAVPLPLSASSPPPFFATSDYARVPRLTAAARAVRYRRRGRPSRAAAAITASLDLTEDNVRLALEEAKSEARKLNCFPFSPDPHGHAVAASS
jgi:hypothetical protein